MFYMCKFETRGNLRPAHTDFHDFAPAQLSQLYTRTRVTEGVQGVAKAPLDFEIGDFPINPLLRIAAV